MPLQTAAQALENCSFFACLFDSRALIATLRHIASTTRTAMPCAPRSHLAFGDRDRWPGPHPAHPPPMRFSSNFMIAISAWGSCRNRTPVKLVRFQLIYEKQASVRESTKRITHVDFLWGGGGVRSQPSNDAVYATGESTRTRAQAKKHKFKRRIERIEQERTSTSR